MRALGIKYLLSFNFYNPIKFIYCYVAILKFNDKSELLTICVKKNITIMQLV